MFSHLFIDRPIFATVLSIVIVIVGDVAFQLGTNLDMAQVLVQNKVKIAEAKLPEDVKRQGVTTKKKSPSILLCVNLISEKQKDPVTRKERFKFDQLYLSNYATNNVMDE